MQRIICTLIVFGLIQSAAVAASKAHVVSFGKATPIKWSDGADGGKTVDAKARALYVDGKLKEFTIGVPHEITDRLFAVQRAVRINDSLPNEADKAPRWIWQPGGWLLVDRVTGHPLQAGFPDFDPYSSTTSWYRDYAAYCGLSADGKKLEALVVQAGSRKPVLKKQLGDLPETNRNEPRCAAPEWQRDPMRVTFEPNHGDKQTYSIRGRAAEVVKDEEDDQSAE